MDVKDVLILAKMDDGTIRQIAAKKDKRMEVIKDLIDDNGYINISKDTYDFIDFGTDDEDNNKEKNNDK